VLEELYVERTGQGSYVGNIYKGVVVNLEPSIQAAFVDFGVGRNGFLHISDVEPQYFRQGGFDPAKAMGPPRDRRPPRRDNAERADRDDDDFAEVGDDDEGPQRKRQFHSGNRPRFKPPIQEILRRGDEVLVQVIKEGIGTKGPTLSTYISIPGRYLVLMPALGRIGVSRKIEDEAVRRRLRDVMIELSPPKGVGFIVRTAGSDRTKRELSRDLAYLLRLWKVIVRRIKKLPGPVDIYEESDMIIRTIRDIFTGDVDTIYIDEPGAYERAREFLQLVMPRYVNRLQLYEGKEPLFHKHDIEEEITKIHRRQVPLKSGGSIVIDQTEALVAIDVNSGSFRVEDSAEETAHRMNMLAAKEIARQLRLRDLGGVIVNDFIDMRRERYRRDVERALRDAMKRDRARTRILRTSPFGLIEMTRQRIRPSLKRSVYTECPSCRGTGMVKTPESMSIEVIRTLLLAAQRPQIVSVVITVAADVADYLNNRKRHELARLEEEGGMTVQVIGAKDVAPEHLVIQCRDAEDREVKFA
jgi:ribonuclease E